MQIKIKKSITGLEKQLFQHKHTIHDMVLGLMNAANAPQHCLT